MSLVLTGLFLNSQLIKILEECLIMYHHTKNMIFLQFCEEVFRSKMFSDIT